MDLEERLTLAEVDVTRLDRAFKKLRGTVTGGIRKEDEPAASSDPHLLDDEEILSGKATFKDA